MNLMSEDALDDDMLIQAYQQSFAKVTEQLDNMIKSTHKNGSPQFTFKSAILGFKENAENRPETAIKAKNPDTKNNQTKQSDIQSSHKSSSAKAKWNVNDHCRAVYREDGQEYEATITEILIANQSCLVKYAGYGNIEAQRLQDLKASQGERVRQAQCQQAKSEQQLTEESEEREKIGGEETQQSDNMVKEKSSIQHTKEANRSQMPQMVFDCPHIPMPLKYLPKPSENEDVDEMLSSMLMSWFMCGYHTGRYVEAKKE